MNLTVPKSVQSCRLAWPIVHPPISILSITSKGTRKLEIKIWRMWKSRVYFRIKGLPGKLSQVSRLNICFPPCSLHKASLRVENSHSNIFKGKLLPGWGSIFATSSSRTYSLIAWLRRPFDKVCIFSLILDKWKTTARTATHITEDNAHRKKCCRHYRTRKILNGKVMIFK